ncbi:rod shape-determining protein MreD [Alphaproteobacteria bacterium]|jgi:rod shape-determining protein MreD|nr:rod shape-determining protein MreD [Alphaproteobacteria bacterium]
MIDRNSSWYWPDYIARHATPTLIATVLVIFTQAPLLLPGIAPVTLGLSLIAVHYWALHQPEMLPAVAIFFVGLLQDMLVGTPIGLSAFSLLCAYGIVVSQRRFFQGKSFLVIWCGFSMTAISVGLLRWVLVSIIEGRMVLFAPTMIEFLLTATLYPLFGYVFVLVHRSLLAEA